VNAPFTYSGEQIVGLVLFTIVVMALAAWAFRRGDP
jgi:ABC-type transport system involved in multi-copper enzyme maturation permease subunit